MAEHRALTIVKATVLDGEGAPAETSADFRVGLTCWCAR